MSQEQPKNPAVDSSLDGSDQFAVRQSKLDHLRESGNDPSVRTGISRILRAKRLNYCPKSWKKDRRFRWPAESLPFVLWARRRFSRSSIGMAKFNPMSAGMKSGRRLMPISRNSTLVTSSGFVVPFFEPRRVKLPYGPRSTGWSPSPSVPCRKNGMD